jgi:hypothetical protein
MKKKKTLVFGAGVRRTLQTFLIKITKLKGPGGT